MRRLLRRREDRARQTSDEPSWDRPAAEEMDDWLTTGLSDGPSWDRPDEEEFAPPIDQRAAHWAFQSAEPVVASTHDSGATADPQAQLHWAFLEPAPPPSEEEWRDDWDDSGAMVSVPRSDGERPARDPAQAGMFDREDVFAAVGEPGAPGATTPDDSFGMRPRGVDTTTASAPPADFVIRPPAADPTQRLPDALSVPGPTPAGERDPLEWPPIPGGILPPVPLGLAPEAATGELSGRRFAWPPPQPVVSSGSPGAEPSRTEPAFAAQEQRWPGRSEAQPKHTPAAPLGTEPRTRRPMALLTIAGTALAVIALLLLVLQLIAGGVR